MDRKSQKILVIRSTAMGDVAMTAPVLARLAVLYPGVEIVLLTREFYEPFFDGIPNVTFHNIDLTRYHRGVRGLGRLYRELRANYPDVDAVVDLQDKIYSKLLRKLYRLAGVKTCHIDKGRQEKKELTAMPESKTAKAGIKVMRQLRTSVERYADVFREAGFELPELTLELAAYRQRRPVPDGLTDVGHDPAAGMFWVGIAPFAQHKGKVYPLEKMREVASRIVEHWPGARLFIFGGGQEEKRLAEVMEGDVLMGGRCVSVVGRFSLREEMDLMANLDLMVSMDSSAMHMASLVGTRVVSVWGATHLYAGFLGLGQSPEDAVGLDDLDCRPCSVYGHRECWRGDYACLNDLPVERIVERVVANLDKA